MNKTIRRVQRKIYCRWNIRKSYWRNQNRTYEWREITTRSRSWTIKYIDSLLKSRAYQKRAIKKDKMLQNIAVKSCAKLINVIDNLESNRFSNQIEEAQNLKKGVEVVYERFPLCTKEEEHWKIDLKPTIRSARHAVQTVPAEEGQKQTMVQCLYQKKDTIKDRVLTSK